MDYAACSKCHLPVLPIFYFCPNCANTLRPKPLSTSIEKQIGIYLFSAFLPPLGLVPGIKYILQKSRKAKIVGIVAVLLTTLSVALTIGLTLRLVGQVREQLDSVLNLQINNQLDNQLNNQIQNIQPQVNQLP